MPHALQVDTPQTAVLLDNLLREHRVGNVVNRTDPRQPGRVPRTQGPIAFVLLEDLESGQEVPVATLRKTDRPLQLLTLRGNVSGGSFQLHYGAIADNTPDPELSSTAIAWNATANTVKAALESIAAIGPGGVDVTLGRIDYVTAAGVETTANVGRWCIEFLQLDAPETLVPFETSEEGILLSGTPNEIEIESHFLKGDGGRATVSTISPFCSTLHVGNIGTAHYHSGFGYQVTTCECRRFVQVGG